MNDIINFLKNRRSVTAKKMKDGHVSDEHLKEIIECGIRVPDHAALNPWKLVILRGDTRKVLGESVLRPEFINNNNNSTEDEILRETNRFLRANVIIAVLFTPVEGTKIPEWEMMLSTGAVCQNLLVAAQSFNYAAQWLTEWYAYNNTMIEKLGGNPRKDKIAGFVGDLSNMESSYIFKEFFDRTLNTNNYDCRDRTDFFNFSSLHLRLNAYYPYFIYAIPEWDLVEVKSTTRD